MDKLEIVIKDLYEENKTLKQQIKILQEQNELLSKDFGGDWVHSKIYRDTIKDLEHARDEYKKTKNELILIKEDYKKQLNLMLEKYK